MTGRSYTRRGFLGLSVAAVAGAGLSACTGAAPEGGPGGQAPAPTTNELRVFTYEGDETIDLFKAAIAKFDAQAGTKTTVEHPDWLRCRTVPRQDPHRAARRRPDFWRIWGGEIGSPYAKAKQAADLAPYYAQYGWDSKINQNAIAGMTFDGVKSGVPFFLAGMGAWYNKALFAEAKVDVPKSYAELEQVNDKLLAAGITPCGTAGKYGWHIMRLFEYLLEQSAGPELHDKLLTGAESWDRPEVVTAFTNFKKWQDKKWIPQGALGLDPADIEPGYVQGKNAYTITGQWTENNAIKSAKKSSADFATFALPTDHTPARHSGFVEGYMINARSANKDKAAALIDFLVQPATQKALGITGSTVTGAEPDKAQLPLSYQWSQINQESPFYTVQDQAFPKQQADQYFTVQSELLQGKTTPAAAAKRMQEIVSTWAKKK